MIQRKTIKKSEINLADEFVIKTGKKIESKDLYLDIFYIEVDKNRGKGGYISGKCRCLLKLDTKSDPTFELLNGGESYSYQLMDDQVFLDIDKNPIPKIDVDGNIVTEEKEVISYDEETGEEVKTIKKIPVFEKDLASRNIKSFKIVAESMLGSFVKFLGFYTKP